VIVASIVIFILVRKYRRRQNWFCSISKKIPQHCWGIRFNFV
jgi:hypothetical protein